jgi:hypothetical protein
LNGASGVVQSAGIAEQSAMEDVSRRDRRARILAGGFMQASAYRAEV